MDYALNNKRRVIRLVLQWAALYGDLLQEDEAAMAFLEVWRNCCVIVLKDLHQVTVEKILSRQMFQVLYIMENAYGSVILSFA